MPEKISRLSEGGAYRDFRIGHLDNSYADYDSLYAYFDDLYVATSRARVELGDAPDFDDCTRRDIQVFTSWSDEEIRLRLRLPDGTDAPRHLFVVDAEGRTASIEIGP